MIQNYKWGYIDWLTDQERTTSEIMDIGIVTILPGKSQEKHIHYGDEQWLYVLSGSGTTFIDNEESKITKGNLLHIAAGSVHEAYNTGEESLVELLISIPKQFDNIKPDEALFYRSVQTLVDVSNQELKLSKESISIINAIGRSLALPITICDTKGEIVHEFGLFPEACKTLCEIHHNLKNCQLYERSIYYSSPAYSEQSAYYCKYGLAVIDTPILLGHQMIGSIRGGHILVEDHLDKLHPKLNALVDNLTNVPKGRIRIILMQYKRLADYISQAQENDYLNSLSAQTSGKNDASNIQSLREDLDLALGKILNLQINNHFLFNTLNAIACLSLEEHADKTYQAIIHLSKLFRFNLKKIQEFVPLLEEIEYIRNYTELQRIRFGDRLEVELDIKADLGKYYIPSNTIQPIIENSFVHGFRNFQDKMKISISVISEHQNISIHVKDNGQGMGTDRLNKLLDSIEDITEKRHGLSMVIDRLHIFFGDEFQFNISSNINQGVEVVFKFPKRTIKSDILGRWT